MQIEGLIYLLTFLKSLKYKLKLLPWKYDISYLIYLILLNVTRIFFVCRQKERQLARVSLACFDLWAAITRRS